MKNTFLLLFLLIFSVSVFAQTNRALIVGLSEYKEISYSDEIERASLDAKNIYMSYVRNDIVLPENILFFENEHAGKYDVILGLYGLIDQSKKGDNLLFYFSGYADVGTDVDSSGYLLFYNVVKEGIYPVSDAIRLTQLQTIAEYAKEKEVNFVMFFDIYSNPGLLGGYEGCEKTLSYLKQEWDGALKIISKDQGQIGSVFRNHKGSLFARSIIEAMGNERNFSFDTLKLEKFCNQVKTSVIRESNHEHSPCIVGKILKKGIQKKVQTTKSSMFQRYYNMSEEYTGALSSFKHEIENQNFYSKLKSPEFVCTKTKTAKIRGDCGIAFDYGDPILGTLKDREIKLYWFNKSGDLGVDFSGARYKEVNSFAVLQDSIFITAHDNGVIKIKNFITNKVLKKHKVSNGDIEMIKFSMDKRYIIVYDEFNILKIFYFNFKSFEISEIAKFTNNNRKVKFIEFYNNNFFVFGDENNNIVFAKLENEEIIELATQKLNSEIVGLEIYRDELYVVEEAGDLNVYSMTSFEKIDHKKIFDNIVCMEKTLSITNYLFIADKNNIHVIGLDNKMCEYTMNLKTEIKDLIFIDSENILVALSGNEISSYMYFKFQEPRFYARSAFANYYYMISKNDVTRLNKEILKMQYSSALLEYINNVVLRFVMGDMIYPTQEEIDLSLFYLELVRKFYIDKKLIQEHIEIQKLILDGYNSMLTENFNTINNSLFKVEILKEKMPYASFPYTQIAQMNTEINNLSAAEQNIMVAIQRMPNWTETMVRKGNIFLRKGLFQEGVNEYKKIIKQDPDDYKGYILVANAFSKMNQYDSTKFYIALAEEKSPDNIFIYNEKAMLFMEFHEYSEAEKALKSAISLSSGYRVSKANNAELKGKTHQFIKTDQTCNILFCDSTFSAPYYLLSDLYLKLGNVKEAEKIVKKGYRLFPDNSNIMISYANLFAFKYLNIQSEFDLGYKALEYYNLAIKKAPYNYKTYLAKSRFLIDLKLKLDNKILSNEDCIFPLNGGKYLQDSISKTLKQSEKFSPGNLDIKYEYARFYNIYSKENLADIQNYYLELENEYVSLYYSGLMLEMQNQTKEAQKNYKKILKKRPDFYPVAERTLQLYLEENNVKKFNKVLEKNDNLNNSAYFNYILETLNGFNGKKSFTNSSCMYTAFYYSTLGVENLKFMENQQENIEDKNWNFKREKIISDTWIIISKNNKYGLMLFNGQILLPMNFDKISYQTDNLFECTRGNEKLIYKMNFTNVEP